MIERVEFDLDILKEAYEKEYSVFQTLRFVFCQQVSFCYSPFYLFSFYFAYQYVVANLENETRFFVCFLVTTVIATLLMHWLTKDKRKSWHELRRIRAYRGAKKSKRDIFKKINIDEAVEYVFPTYETLFEVLKNNLGVTVIVALVTLLLSEIISKETLAHLYTALGILIVISSMYLPLFFIHISSKSLRKKEYRNWLISCCQYEDTLESKVF